LATSALRNALWAGVSSVRSVLVVEEVFRAAAEHAEQPGNDRALPRLG
jgi:hypothetical protein